MNWIKKLRRRFRKKKKEPVKRSGSSKFVSFYSKELIKRAEGKPFEFYKYEPLSSGLTYNEGKLFEECDDCISRTDALNINLDKIRYINDGILYLSYMDVLREIRLLPPAVSKSRWIPCSERLPQLDEFVLCTVPCDNRVIIAIYQEEEWWSNGTITAWMPLPEPYKGGRRMTREEIVMKFVDIDNNKKEIAESGISFAVMMGDGNGGVITSAGDPDEILEMLIKTLVGIYDECEEGTILDFSKMIGVAILGEHFFRKMKKE